MKSMDPRSRSIVTVLTVAIALLLLTATMVAASHNFSDVKTSSLYHAAVDWGVDRGLIAGCGSGKFCPNDPLTRAQAMAIMRGLGNVVSPGFLTSQSGPLSVDLDASSPVVCGTTDSNKPYETVAYGYARTTLDRAGIATNPVAFVGKIVYRTETGGIGPWILMPPEVSSTSQSNTANEAIHNVHFGTLNLAPNTKYRFAIRLEKRDNLSSGDSAAEGQMSCALVVQIFNRPL
jgi:hypothetical protein